MLTILGNDFALLTFWLSTLLVLDAQDVVILMHYESWEFTMSDEELCSPFKKGSVHMKIC